MSAEQKIEEPEPKVKIEDDAEPEQETQSLEQIIEGLPLAERARVSEQYARWYNLLIKLYTRDFGLDDTGDNVREFKTEDQVIIFFREALLWWWRRKPTVGEVMTPLEAIKTRTCLGQIHSLKTRLETTGISLKKLKLNENFDKAKMSGDAKPAQTEPTVK